MELIVSLVKRNIIANYGGRAWQAIMSLAFVPLYIKFMGIESYGLVGLFISFQTVFSLLDMGLSKTINWELAILSTSTKNAQEMRNFVRTLELPYWGVAFLIGLIVISLSWPIAHYWLNYDNLATDVVQQSIMIMGIVMAFHWPISLYSGGLMGLQKHVLLNCINIFFSTLKGVGAVLVLWLISPTIQAFFIWHIFASMVFTTMTAVFLWRSLPESEERSSFQKQQFLKVWRFTAGVTGISFTAILLTQADKIILSKILPLEMFGYYALATAVASTLYHFIRPVQSAIFPRFTQLVSLNDQSSLIRLYHKSCQCIALSILPAALVVSFFSTEILLLWIGDPVTVENTHTLVSILIIGTAFNGLMNLPYAVQLAHAWTKLGLCTNLVATIILVPMVYFLARQYGVVGAACAWLFLNTGYIIIVIQIMHNSILKGEKWRWYFNDVAVPMLSALIIVSFWRVILPGEMSKISMFLALLCVSSTTLFGSALATSVTRQWIKQKFKMIKGCA
jgi:O-antigen/teichoic acid export membrane protein